MAIAKSLQRLCRETLPLMLREASGKELMGSVREVSATDRWNSFDRFHETTETLVRRYEVAGAHAEVESIQTGGRIGRVDGSSKRRAMSGRQPWMWCIQ